MQDLLAVSFLEEPIQPWDIQTREMVRTLSSKLPYEGMNITGVIEISEGQKANLKDLGAIET